MKLFDPTERKEVEVFKKTFELIMKPGTKGTYDDPNVPLVEDILGRVAQKWIVDDQRNTIAVWASMDGLNRIAKSHKEAP